MEGPYTVPRADGGRQVAWAWFGGLPGTRPTTSRLVVTFEAIGCRCRSPNLAHWMEPDSRPRPGRRHRWPAPGAWLFIVDHAPDDGTRSDRTGRTRDRGDARTGRQVSSSSGR